MLLAQYKITNGLHIANQANLKKEIAVKCNTSSALSAYYKACKFSL